MSNMQVQLFNSSIRRLTESLIIKDENMADNVNLPILAEYAAQGRSMEDIPKKEWKYYMNMAGKYHFTDEPMYVISIDTMETIPFTIEALDLHRGTRREYRTKGRYYQELVKKYPTQEALIKGILNPANIDWAIQAPNYTILQYDKNEIEYQETNLIPRIQDYIYAVMRRWVVRDYSNVDPAYPSMQMVNLYLFLPKVISTIRLENCKTYKAHTFHIWNYLDSYGRLAEFKDYLLTKQALWLYMNIDWVYVNIGKQDTFHTLVEQILTARGIPLGQYSTALETSTVAEELYAKPFMKRLPLNLLERVGDGAVDKSLNYVMQKQIPLVRDNLIAHNSAVESVTEALQKNIVSSYPTKIYESEMIDLTEGLYVTREEVLIENWMYLAAKGKYTALINIQNPSTSEVMTMSVKDAFVMWLYAINRTLGHTLTTIPSIVAHRVPRLVRPTVAQLRKLTSPRYVTDAQLDYLVSETPIPTPIISTASFYDYADDLHKVILAHRKFHTSNDHKDTRGQLEAVVQRLLPSVHCEFDMLQDTYDQYFLANEWDIQDLNEIDMKLLAEDLLSISTGLNLNDVTSMAEIQKAMLRLLARLSEYSSQFISSINTEPATIADIVNIRIGDVDAKDYKFTSQVVGVNAKLRGSKETLHTKSQLVAKMDWADRRQKTSKLDSVDIRVKARGDAQKIIPIRFDHRGVHAR